jgi:hypothetical protein
MNLFPDYIRYVCLAGKRIRRMLDSYRQCPVTVADPALAGTRDADLWRAHCKQLSDADNGGFYEVVPECGTSGLPALGSWHNVDNWHVKHGGAGLFIGLMVSND